MEIEKEPNTKLLFFIIFTLAIILLASIIFNIFLFAKSQSRIFDCNLGDRIEVQYSEQDNIIMANVVYPSNIVYGTTYSQPVILQTSQLVNSYYVRAKVIYADYNIIGEEIDVSISPDAEWVIGPSNYYYLHSILDSWQEIPFLEKLTLPSISTTVLNNTIITIYFEFLDTHFDVETLWKIPTTFFE